MRVTTVLRLSGLRPAMLHVKDPEWYLRRGSIIHKAVALMDQGKLDWTSLDERIVPFVKAAQKFRAECGGKLVAAEMEVADLTRGIVGHLDAIYRGMRLRGHKNKLCLVDWKTNQVDDATAVQTAAYAEMSTLRIAHRCGVALHDDGSYKVTWFTDYAGDLAGWYGAVEVAKWRLRNGQMEDGEQDRKEELT